MGGGAAHTEIFVVFFFILIKYANFLTSLLSSSLRKVPTHWQARVTRQANMQHEKLTQFFLVLPKRSTGHASVREASVLTADEDEWLKVVAVSRKPIPRWKINKQER